MLDLTAYEIGNALLRGRANATVEQVATVLEALDQFCPAIRPGPAELRIAAHLAARHDITFYDAAYAAVAKSRDATVATLDRAFLLAGLGRRPSELGVSSA